MNSCKIWDEIRNNSYKAEQEMDLISRKITGSYYTDLCLTDVLMGELLCKFDLKSDNICKYSFLEPCVGSGNFVFSFLKAIKEIIYNKEEAEELIQNIYVADVNVNSINYYKKSLRLLVKHYWGIDIKDSYFERNVGSGLIFDITKSEQKYIPIDKAFNGNIFNKKFDIIATNPPYRLLKACHGNYDNIVDYNNEQHKYMEIKRIAKQKFKYSNIGVLNLYKFFIEEILENYSSATAFISLLVPFSILSDKASEKLRENILVNYCLHSVKIIRESNNFTNAKQSLCSLLISKARQTETIEVVKDFCYKPNDVISVSINSIKNIGRNIIMPISDDDNRRLKTISAFPTVKELNFIVNLRGELDLSIDKKYINKQNSNISLIKGRNLSLFHINRKHLKEFVSVDFLKITAKKEYIRCARIACQQIANINKNRRIIFTYIPANHILANSCNFIYVKSNKYCIDIFALLGLFNSECINWLFKLTSTNNHINNYDIDKFPIPINSKFIKQISSTVKQYIETKDAKLLDKINRWCLLAYGFDESEKFNG